MSLPVQYKEGEAAYLQLDSSGRNRWGDYSLTTVDPLDDLSFVTVQEYARPENEWGTWIAEFAFDPLPDCNGTAFPMPPISQQEPAWTATATGSPTSAI